MRVRVAEGPPQSNRTPLPGDETWLIGERRNTGERKYYLSDLPPDLLITHIVIQAGRVGRHTGL